MSGLGEISVSDAICNTLFNETFKTFKTGISCLW